MAGHSQFKNIMHRKGAQDAKKAKIFTKVVREIKAACKSGMIDPTHNPRLRSALLKARQENISKEKIDEALKRASGQNNTDNYDEIRYEGYGAGGVAVIVEALTDNRNRTASDVRAIFSKYSGNLGETGSVSFMFERVGLISYPLKSISSDAILDMAIENGAQNCESDATQHNITCLIEDFTTIRDKIEKKLGEPQMAKLTWIPKTTAPANEDQAISLLKMLDALEDNDDVQEVYANYEISDAILEKISE
jgi:YebC/PmpR family DNA-binding regulatory protein